MTLKIVQKQISSLPAMRIRYLQTLSFAQELFLENQIADAIQYEISVDNHTSGYGLVNDGTIIEFFMDTAPYRVGVLKMLVQESLAAQVICKSFDTFFYEACAELGWRSNSSAMLYRKFVPSSLKLFIQTRLAVREDIGAILSIHDGFFDSVDEILSYFASDARLFVYSDGANLIGCGIVKRIVPCRDEFDIGFVVAPAQRQKGHGAQIAVHLKTHCQSLQWSPVAGCSITNLVSQRTLEHAGFISEHSLYTFLPRQSEDD